MYLIQCLRIGLRNYSVVGLGEGENLHLFVCFSVLKVEFRTLHSLGVHSTTELHPSLALIWSSDVTEHFVLPFAELTHCERFSTLGSQSYSVGHTLSTASLFQVSTMTALQPSSLHRSQPGWVLPSALTLSLTSVSEVWFLSWIFMWGSINKCLSNVYCVLLSLPRTCLPPWARA